MHALLILNGHSAIPSAVLATPESFDVIAAADGAVHAIPGAFRLDLVCGDFDSAELDYCRSAFPNAEVVHLPDQSCSDLEKSLKLLLSRGIHRITIVRALGGRIDHMLSVVSALVTHHAAARITVADTDAVFEVVSNGAYGGGTRGITCCQNDLISILPLSPHATVTVSGVQWPLSNQVIAAGTGGVSNRAADETVRLTVSDGIVCFCHLAEHWQNAARP